MVHYNDVEWEQIKIYILIFAFLQQTCNYWPQTQDCDNTNTHTPKNTHPKILLQHTVAIESYATHRNNRILQAFTLWLSTDKRKVCNLNVTYHTPLTARVLTSHHYISLVFPAFLQHAQNAELQCWYELDRAAVPKWPLPTSTLRMPCDTNTSRSSLN